MAAAAADPVLTLDGLTAGYNGSPVLRDVSLTVRPGEVVALLGANGAGKTTTLRTIVGVLKPMRGRVLFGGDDLAGQSVDARARQGVAHVPEGRGTFGRMTTEENLQLGAMSRRDRAGIADDIERVYAYFPRLKERRAQQAGTLSGGEQQMLAIGRALMSRPRLLLLDEPSLGLAPLIARQIFDAIRTLNRQDGLTVLIVEQNANHALRLAHRGYVMVNGQITLSGPGRELLANPEVRAAYLEGGHG